MVNVSTRTGEVGTALKPRRSGRGHERMWASLFLAPAIIVLVILRVLPTISAVVSSLYRGFPGGLVPAKFFGLGNFKALFNDPLFVDTIVRTLLFNVVINPLQIILSLLIAILMTRRIALTGLWRTLVFIPITVPIVGSCIAWGAALSPQGPINAFIAATVGHPQPFLTAPSQALGSIMVIASWIGIGYWMIFLIAGLQAIPEEIIEVAQLDRASAWQILTRITIPLLKRPLLFVLVADTVANFILFVPIQLLTGGGPQNSTTLLMFDAYQTTYTYGSKNTGAAQILILTLIMLVFVVMQFRLLREER